MPTTKTHMLRIAPGTARRLKAYARQNGQTMDGAVNSLLDDVGFPRNHMPDPYAWAGEQDSLERFHEMLQAAEAAGDDALADFARNRLRQIEDAISGKNKEAGE